jgi:hypothetical protein
MFKNYSRTHKLTVIGLVLTGILGFLGLFSSGFNNINGIVSFLNFNFGQQEVSYYEQNHASKQRNIEGLMQTMSPLINGDLRISIKSLVSDQEAQNLAVAAVGYLRRTGHQVTYDYCLHSKPLPNGLWYYQSSTTIQIFIGANNGSYNLNPLMLPIECQLEVSYFGGMDNLQSFVDGYLHPQASLETFIRYNPEAKVPELQGTFSTSSAIHGELCLSSVEDACLVPCVSVGRGYPIIGYVTKDDCF